jgi:DNA-binding transcriptional regulator YdaS (Cro superfamily)
MTLKKWIEKNGAPEIARLLGVLPATVNYWRRGESYPRVEQMREIKKITRGAVGYEQIIDGHRLGRGV